MVFTDKKSYVKYAESREKVTKTVKNCVFAFLTGGIICVFGKLITDFYVLLGSENETACTLASCTLIVLAGVFTGLGLFSKAANVCGAGLLVPITGFSNAVVSSAIDSSAEGYILGIGADMFKIAGPVILYGNLFSAVYGVIYFILGKVCV